MGKKPTKKDVDTEYIIKKRGPGRPRTFQTVKQLQDAIDDYFENPPNVRRHYSKYDKTDDGDRAYEEIPVYTISGLALFLGFVDRQSIYDYVKRNDSFSCIIKRACFFIESEYEVALRDNNVAGVIFALKNMGWRDKQEHEHSGKVTHDVMLNKALKRSKG